MSGDKGFRRESVREGGKGVGRGSGSTISPECGRGHLQGGGAHRGHTVKGEGSNA